MSLIDLATSSPVLMSPQHYAGILDILDRSPNAFEQYSALKVPRSEALRSVETQNIEGTRINHHKGVAVIPVTGPIFKHASIMSEMSGATSASTIARDIQAALDNPSIKGIVLDIDSPGGQVSGISELSSMIYEGRSKKQIVAYVDGLACSAAYWVASACSSIVMSDTAEAGSIGCVWCSEDRTEADVKRGVRKIQIVSGQSPNKRPDLTTEDGRTDLQKNVDATAAVFISSVAKYRGVSEATVLSDFGQGGCFVGADAVKAGLADKLGTFQSVINGVLENRYALTMGGEKNMGFIEKLSAFFEGEGIKVDGISQPEAVSEPVAIPVAMQEASFVSSDLASIREEVLTAKLGAARELAGIKADMLLQRGKVFPAESAAVNALFVQCAVDDITSPIVDSKRLEMAMLAFDSRVENKMTQELAVSSGQVTALPVAPSADDADKARIQAEKDRTFSATDEGRKFLKERDAKK